MRTLTSQIADEIDDRRADGAAHGGGTCPDPPDASQLLAAALLRLDAAREARTGILNAHQAARARLSTDPGIETDAALRAARQADEANLDEIRCAEFAVDSYRVRAGQQVLDRQQRLAAEEAARERRRLAHERAMDRYMESLKPTEADE